MTGFLISGGIMKIIMILILCAFAVSAQFACETVKGVGQDIINVSEALTPK